jgi:hypothetical protein
MGAGKYLKLLQNQLPANDPDLGLQEYLALLMMTLVATGQSPELTALRSKAITDGDTAAVAFFNKILAAGSPSIDELETQVSSAGSGPATGSYTGNGTTQDIALPQAPKFLIIIGYNTATFEVWIDQFGAGESMGFPSAGTFDYHTGNLSVSGTTLTVNTNSTDSTNENGSTYMWIAF